MNKKEIKALEEIKTTVGASQIFEYLARTNKKKFNFSKLAEELTELNEICLKYINKKKEFKPTKEKFIEEIGDVRIRLGILEQALGINVLDISNRIIFKANKFLEYIKEDKYDKGI